MSKGRKARSTELVDGVPVSELADYLMDLVLLPREEILKHKAPRSRYVAELIRKIRAKRATPMQMLCALLFADVEETRLPIGSITKPLEILVTMLQQRRRELEVHGVNAPSMLPLMLRESRAEAALNEAQLKVTESPDDAEALELLLQKNAEYDVAQNQLMAAARDRLAAIRARQGQVPSPKRTP